MENNTSSRIYETDNDFFEDIQTFFLSNIDVQFVSLNDNYRRKREIREKEGFTLY